jgi:hypothetical protein
MYNLTLMTEATNIAHYFLIINHYTNSIMGNVVGVIVFIVLFGIMRFSQVNTIEAFTASSFLSLLITVFMWLITWNGLILINTFLPVAFALMTGIGLILLMTRRSLES